MSEAQSCRHETLPMSFRDSTKRDLFARRFSTEWDGCVWFLCLLFLLLRRFIYFARSCRRLRGGGGGRCTNTRTRRRYVFGGWERDAANLQFFLSFLNFFLLFSLFNFSFFSLFMCVLSSNTLLLPTTMPQCRSETSVLYFRYVRFFSALSFVLWIRCDSRLLLCERVFGVSIVWIFSFRARC